MLHYSSKKIEFSRLDLYRNFGFGRRLRLCLQVLKMLQTIYCMIGTVTHLHVPSISQRKVLFYHQFISFYYFYLFIIKLFLKNKLPVLCLERQAILNKENPEKCVCLFLTLLLRGNTELTFWISNDLTYNIWKINISS